MSDIEHLVEMLGNFPQNDSENKPDNEQEVDSGSAKLHENTSTLTEDFRSSLISNSRRNSDLTIETVKMINKELSTQMSRKLEEIEMGLDSQILALSLKKSSPDCRKASER